MVDTSSARVWRRRRGSSGFTPGPAPSCYVSLDQFLCLLYRILRALKGAKGASQALPTPTPYQGTGGCTCSTSFLLKQYDTHSQCIFFPP
ncbi:mCG142538 [Mus musculus]|nr:mCG142538 [Mus musculus]